MLVALSDRLTSSATLDVRGVYRLQPYMRESGRKRLTTEENFWRNLLRRLATGGDGCGKAVFEYATRASGYPKVSFGYSKVFSEYPIVTSGNPKLTLGYSEVTIEYPLVTIGYLKLTNGYSEVTLGYPKLTLGYAKIQVTYPKMASGYMEAHRLNRFLPLF